MTEQLRWPADPVIVEGEDGRKYIWRFGCDINGIYFAEMSDKETGKIIKSPTLHSDREIAITIFNNLFAQKK